ncbi:MAG TPA: hypothetical protein VKP69_04225, partial [Isosphaeraceae bacterium]|nr:hypothetical protein [Isosphaeraceae bacterium]
MVSHHLGGRESRVGYVSIRRSPKSDESLVFFGRDEQVDQLLERLRTRKLLAVVGTSGCGKSSLVRAGLIPALETGLMGEAGARWAFAKMSPGDQ